MTKKVMSISMIGMLASFFLCVSVAENSTWFAVGFAFFLGNISMFYLALKRNDLGRDSK